MLGRSRHQRRERRRNSLGVRSRDVSFGVFAARALESGEIDGFWANAMGAETAVSRGVGRVLIDVRRGVFADAIMAVYCHCRLSFVISLSLCKRSGLFTFERDCADMSCFFESRHTYPFR